MANIADLFLAARVLSVAASSEPMTLVDIARGLGVDVDIQKRILRLARATLARCTDAGTWRAARAEAEARLRLQARRMERCRG